tara:strand:- start:206 stop:367 length:162 start_codon:yes stop_codon:yes gene_type:complete
MPDVPGIWIIGDIPSLLGICFGEADIFLEMSKNLLQTDSWSEFFCAVVLAALC